MNVERVSELLTYPAICQPELSNFVIDPAFSSFISSPRTGAKTAAKAIVRVATSALKGRADITEISSSARLTGLSGNNLNHSDVTGAHSPRSSEHQSIHSGRKTMKVAALGLCIIALMLGACRRESPEYAPMKLGGANAASQPAQQ
ncbi:MAG TPA: hypothetical protein PKE16_16805 [Hyphomicrobium sp.]|nr:hypothetical protein [Hyphomicrobium sp.]